MPRLVFAWRIGPNPPGVSRPPDPSKATWCKRLLWQEVIGYACSTRGHYICVD